MRFFLSIASATAISLLFAGSVNASSDDAWGEFYDRVTKACISASKIANSRPSTIIDFDDRVGFVAMLVSDRTRGSNISKLCLYNKRTEKAVVQDADVWSAPPQNF